MNNKWRACVVVGSNLRGKEMIVTLTQLSATLMQVNVNGAFPSTNSDGSPLSDLQHVKLFTQSPGGTKLERKTWIPLSPAGGDPLVDSVQFSVSTADTSLTAFLKAEDFNGNFSETSYPLVIDRLAPSPVV